MRLLVGRLRGDPKEVLRDVGVAIGGPTQGGAEPVGNKAEMDTAAFPLNGLNQRHVIFITSKEKSDIIVVAVSVS